MSPKDYGKNPGKLSAAPRTVQQDI